MTPAADEDPAISLVEELVPSRQRRYSVSKNITARQTSHWDVSNLSTQIITEQMPTAFEGKKNKIYVNAFERDQNARRLCIQAHGFACSVCRMKFEDEFGDIGKGFIHVHHLRPFSHVGARETNPFDDLRPVCPNCHAMLHRSESIIGRAYSIDELRDFRSRAKKRAAERLWRKKRQHAH
jgi:predicted HNH restriction endonuclease